MNPSLQTVDRYTANALSRAAVSAELRSRDDTNVFTRVRDPVVMRSRRMSPRVGHRLSVRSSLSTNNSKRARSNVYPFPATGKAATWVANAVYRILRSVPSLKAHDGRAVQYCRNEASVDSRASN